MDLDKEMDIARQEVLLRYEKEEIKVESTKFYKDVFEVLNKKLIDKKELKEKINKVILDLFKEFDIDGREILYQLTDTDLEYLKEKILKLLEE